MTLILLVGDIHVSDKPPVNCTDTYTQDIIEMLHWVARLEDSLEAEATVWAGDIFHHKAPSKNSHALVLSMIDVVKAHRNLWIVPGNHDISNDRLDSIHEKQPLGVLYAAGANELSGWHPTLPLFGVPWQQGWTTDERAAWNAFAAWRLDTPRFGQAKAQALAVTHAPIYPPHDENQMFDLVPTSGEHGLSTAMGNEGHLYYGHIHEDHGIFEVEGVSYANMGAISRGSLNDYNATREIKISVWSDEHVYGSDDIIGDFEFFPGFNVVAVPHRPASEVFRMAQAADVKEQRLDLAAFLDRVGRSSLAITSTAAVVEHINAREDVSPIVKTRAVGFLEDADA